jgi:hypothetical protein
MYLKQSCLKIKIYPEELDRLEIKEEKNTESRDEKMKHLKELLDKFYEEQEAEKRKKITHYINPYDLKESKNL